MEKVQVLTQPWPEHVVKSAARYLNEAGVVVFIETDALQVVVLDPNWFCREIIGRVFLTDNMTSASEDIFRQEVDQTRGSILIEKFKRFFRSISQG
jgi:hypothetical protein